MLSRGKRKRLELESREAQAGSEDPLKWHLGFIAELAKTVRPDVYIELGVHRAELFNRVIPYARQLIGVDIDATAGDYIGKTPNVRFVCGTTDDFVEELRTSGLMIDMLFIDANHCRESVMTDFRNYSPFVRPHGLILLHDTHPGDASLLDPGWCGDAYRAVEDLQRDLDGFEMVTIPVSPRLTLCRKRTAQLSWMENDSDHGGAA